MVEIISRFVKKSTTNDGEQAKQYFFIVKDEGYEKALVIHKYVLIKDERHIESYERTGHVFVKSFKDAKLYFSRFAIKISTLDEVIYWLLSV